MAPSEKESSSDEACPHTKLISPASGVPVAQAVCFQAQSSLC